MGRPGRGTDEGAGHRRNRLRRRNVVRALVEDGVDVRVLARAGSDRRALAGLPVEVVTGDLLTPRSLEAPLRGRRRCSTTWRPTTASGLPTPRCSTASTSAERGRSSWPRRRRRRARGSSTRRASAPWACPADGRRGRRRRRSGSSDMVGDYKRSKFLGEREAEAAAARGLPVVIVNPSAPVGPLGLEAHSDRPDAGGLPAGPDARLPRIPG